METQDEETQKNIEHHGRLERLNAERKAATQVIRERMSGAIIGAFGLVAGIAWNDAVKALIDHFYPPSQGGDILPKFLYALIVTVIVSILIYVITKILIRDKPKP
jgi:hypothetical protein